MRDYPFSYEQLFNFSKSHPYTNLGDKKELFEQLEFSRKKLNFPAIENDIGSLFNFIFKLKDKYGDELAQKVDKFWKHQQNFERIFYNAKRYIRMGKSKVNNKIKPLV